MTTDEIMAVVRELYLEDGDGYWEPSFHWINPSMMDGIVKKLQVEEFDTTMDVHSLEEYEVAVRQGRI